LKKSFFITFFRYQIAAIIATTADFGIYFLLKYASDSWYLLATFLGALTGAIINFIICRYWAFAATNKAIITQATRYILVSGGSLIMNTSFVYFITEFLNVPSDFSKVIASIIVALSYNFLLQKYFVFKQ
jgi:putative flippase GtrA